MNMLAQKIEAGKANWIMRKKLENGKFSSYQYSENGLAFFDYEHQLLVSEAEAEEVLMEYYNGKAEDGILNGLLMPVRIPEIGSAMLEKTKKAFPDQIEWLESVAGKYVFYFFPLGSKKAMTFDEKIEVLQNLYKWDLAAKSSEPEKIQSAELTIRLTKKEFFFLLQKCTDYLVEDFTVEYEEMEKVLKEMQEEGTYKNKGYAMEKLLFGNANYSVSKIDGKIRFSRKGKNSYTYNVQLKTCTWTPSGWIKTSPAFCVGRKHK